MSVKLGKNAKAYVSATTITGVDDAARETAITSALTSAEVINVVRDLSIGIQRGTADSACRGDDVDYMAPLQVDGTISGEVKFKPDDAAYELLEAAAANGTPVFLAGLSGAGSVAGSRGLAGNYIISNFTRTEALRDIVKCTLEAKPYSDVIFYEVPSS